MKAKLDIFIRAFRLCLLLALAWSLWASAQPTTNSPAPGSSAAAAAPTKDTNQPSKLVEKIERFDEHYLTFGLDRVEPLREISLVGQPLWKYVASLIYVLLAFYVSKLLNWVAGVWLTRWAAKGQTKLRDLVIGLLRGPIKLVAFVILLNIGLNVFDWPPAAQGFFSKCLIIILAGSLTYLAIKISGLLLEAWRERTAHEPDGKFDEQLFSILGKSLNTFLIIVAALVTAQNIGINITAALASLSVGGLAVGLAAQDTLANLFGAIAVFADKPFRVGDQIKLPDAEGIVESVGLRSTRVRNPDGHLVVIPNKTVGNATVTNVSERPGIKTVMNLALARTLGAAKVRRALAVLEEIYRGHPMTHTVSVSFNQFTGGNVNILIVHWWKGTDYQKWLAGMQEMNLAVKERFDAEEITFA
jgi:MscS family membrane protein